MREVLDLEAERPVLEVRLAGKVFELSPMEIALAGDDVIREKGSDRELMSAVRRASGILDLSDDAALVLLVRAREMTQALAESKKKRPSAPDSAASMGSAGRKRRS